MDLTDLTYSNFHLVLEPSHRFDSPAAYVQVLEVWLLGRGRVGQVQHPAEAEAEARLDQVSVNL